MVFFTCTPWSWTSTGSRDSVSCTRFRVSIRATFGSVPITVDAQEAGWRLAAVADGLESILYLGLLDASAARALLASCVERELAA